MKTAAMPQDHQGGERARQTGAEVIKPMGRPRDSKVSDAILDAALRQIVDVGYAHMSIESVASEAGVSRATVYRRYHDKADLVTTAIAQNGGGIFPARPSVDPRADLVKFLRDFDERFGEHCIEILGSLLGARQDARALTLHRQRVIAPRMEYARGLLERARELGDIGAEGDIELALEMLAGSVFARRVSGVHSPTDWAERAVAMVWRGLAPS
jgi:AcrR family transcriptional regulator